MKESVEAGVAQPRAPGADLSLPAARARARAAGGARRGAIGSARGCDAGIAPRCTVTNRDRVHVCLWS
jgi:hypothetical protein